MIHSPDTSCFMRNKLPEEHLKTIPGSTHPSKPLTTGVLNEYQKKMILDRVYNYTLSQDVQHFVKEYEKVFNIRNTFLWKWVGVVYGETGVILSTADTTYHDSITELKILFTMAVTVIDDVAELYKDEELLGKIFDIIRNQETPLENEEKKVVFFKNVWNHFLEVLKSYPRYEEFKDIFWYDFEQLMNTARYNLLVSKHPEMMNLQEIHNYDCHNMIVFLLNGIDLMVSPSFDKKDLAYMRTAFWHAQQMARIGNWLSTWKRELREKDFCSGVFAYAFMNGIIDVHDVEKLSDEEIIQRIETSDMQGYFMEIWKENYAKLSALKSKIHSVDMDAYIRGLENVIQFHLASEGLK